ncbi:MAG: hypothetical protein LPK00_13210 [Bacillaceae bacterium]|nr:hypothetical protein [Bacillaceae bacterium]
MSTELILGIIGALTGVSSLFLYTFEILRHRPKITVKIIKCRIETHAINDIGDAIIQQYTNKDELINSINEYRHPKDVYHGIEITLLLSNKGNKKATVNDIRLKNKYFEKLIDLKKELIPLDVGESIKVSYYIRLLTIDQLNEFLENENYLIITDNRDKEIKVKIEINNN